MSPFSNLFEKKWFFIMMFFYFFIMLPFPFYFNTEYNPVFLGIPDYVVGWLAHSAIVVALIVVWRNQCMARPEYQEESKGEGE